MPKPNPLTKEQILAAMAKTKSNMAAARYLNVSYQHYKKWAKIYEANEEGFKTLFDQHKNQSGKGIPKFLRGNGKEPALIDIIEGRANATSFSPEKIKYRLITEGYLLEECAQCGFSERRVLDYKMPLLLHFKDGNKSVEGAYNKGLKDGNWVYYSTNGSQEKMQVYEYGDLIKTLTKENGEVKTIHH